MDDIINRVERSGLITLNLEEVLGNIEIVDYDLSIHLFQGLVLREKEFRREIKEVDWSFYAGKRVAVFCSADAIVPIWAFMLILSKIQPYTDHVMLGRREEVLNKLVFERIKGLNIDEYKNAKVVVKGCNDKGVPLIAYGEIMRRLMPIVSSIMFGEPCSTVPLFKNKKPN